MEMRQKRDLGKIGLQMWKPVNCEIVNFLTVFPWHGDRTGDGRSINKVRLHPRGCIESLKRPLTLRVTASNFFCCMNSYSLRTATCIFALVTVLICNGNILTRGTQGSKDCMRDSSIAFSSLLFSFLCIFV